MNSNAPAPFLFRQLLAAALVGLGLAAAAFPGHAQSPLMKCADPVPQDPSRVFRSGLWKQWIYWAIPGPSAYAAVQRIVAEANVSRGTAGLPYLIANPTFEIVVSVFDERNARGANGSSALPVTANQEAFLATFVTDTQGGFEVLFLTDPMRSNDILTTVKAVPGVAASIERRLEIAGRTRRRENRNRLGDRVGRRRPDPLQRPLSGQRRVRQRGHSGGTRRL